MRTTVPKRTLRISHRTRYVYQDPVALSLHKGYFEPRTTPFQDVAKTRLTVHPACLSPTTWVDYFGNNATLFTIDERHNQLTVEADTELTMSVRSTDGLPVCDLSLAAVRARIHQPKTQQDLAAYEFSFHSPHVSQSAEFARYATSCIGELDTYRAGVEDLMHRIHSEFQYDSAMTTVSTPVSEVFAHRHGVCQDFAHLMIACLRSIGVAARYVSGYLIPGPGVIGAQASHAWISAYCPGEGWVDFDPTNDVSPTDGHIVLAWGRDYSDVSPLRGVVVGGGEHEVSVEVMIESLSLDT